MLKPTPHFKISLALLSATLTASAGTIVQVATNAWSGESPDSPYSESCSARGTGSTSVSCSSRIPGLPDFAGSAYAGATVQEGQLAMNVYTTAVGGTMDYPLSGSSYSASATIDSRFLLGGGSGPAYMAVDFVGFQLGNHGGAFGSWSLSIDGTDYTNLASAVLDCVDAGCYTFYTNAIYLPVVFNSTHTVELHASASGQGTVPPEAEFRFSVEPSSFSIVDSDHNPIEGGGLQLVPEPSTWLAVVPSLGLFLFWGGSDVSCREGETPGGQEVFLAMVSPFGRNAGYQRHVSSNHRRRRVARKLSL